MVKGALEDRLTYLYRLAQLSICWRRTPGVPRDCLLAALDDRVGWKEKS